MATHAPTSDLESLERTEQVRQFMVRKQYPVDSVVIHPDTPWIITIHYGGQAYDACLDEIAHPPSPLERFRLGLLRNAEVELTPAMLRSRFGLHAQVLRREVFQPGRHVFQSSKGGSPLAIHSLDLTIADANCSVLLCDLREAKMPLEDISALPIPMKDFATLYQRGEMQLVA